MASLTESLQRNNKTIYAALLIVLCVFMLLDYIPGCSAVSSWVTPPVALFLGLAFALFMWAGAPQVQ